jgi:hypothetical protein
VFKQNDRVKVIKTGEIGYVERVFDGGERVMVRIPASNGWPYPHHVYAVRENLHYAHEKPEPKKLKPLDWEAPL